MGLLTVPELQDPLPALLLGQSTRFLSKFSTKTPCCSGKTPIISLKVLANLARWAYALYTIFWSRDIIDDVTQY
jgi:hypothetical protein